MSSTQLQDRLAALKVKLKTSDFKSKLCDTGKTELDTQHPEAAHVGSVIYESPTSRQPPQSAHLDSDTAALRSKVAHLEANIKDSIRSKHQLQSELEVANQKLTVLKEQLMTSQTDAEECGRQIVEETANKLAARHANEVERMKSKLQEQDRLIQQLEQKAVQQAADLEHSMQARDSVETLQQRVMSAESAAATAQQATARLQAERNNLEAAIGELTYEAERVQKLELTTCQAQDEAKRATEAAYNAQGMVQGAQANAEHERKRAAELQVRCLQLEQQLASLGSENLNLHNQVEERSTDLSKWQQSSISPEDRDCIISALFALVKGESDAATALENIGQLLKLAGSDLEDLKAHGQHISRNKGFLQRFRRLPGHLLGDGETTRHVDSANESASGEKSIAKSWASFLLTDEAEAQSPATATNNVDGPKT